jgi:hypothetical protein
MRIRLLKSIGASAAIVSLILLRPTAVIAADQAAAANPATKDTATDFVGVEGDPLQ